MQGSDLYYIVLHEDLKIYYSDINASNIYYNNYKVKI